MVGKDVTVKDITRGIYLSQRDAVSEDLLRKRMMLVQQRTAHILVCKRW
ncbi:MAG: hypothetical protein HS127_00830 [Planctomycetia bacterium]|nr:hypothetical protein [Planctomycetia bacterium]